MLEPGSDPLLGRQTETLLAAITAESNQHANPSSGQLDDLAVTATTLDDGADKADVYLAIATRLHPGS